MAEKMKAKAHILLIMVYKSLLLIPLYRFVSYRGKILQNYCTTTL